MKRRKVMKTLKLLCMVFVALGAIGVIGTIYAYAQSASSSTCTSSFSTDERTEDGEATTANGKTVKFHFWSPIDGEGTSTSVTKGLTLTDIVTKPDDATVQYHYWTYATPTGTCAGGRSKIGILTGSHDGALFYNVCSPKSGETGPTTTAADGTFASDIMSNGQIHYRYYTMGSGS